MPMLYCDLDDTRKVPCGLSDPLQFEDGYAEVDSEEVAVDIVARHTHIHHAADDVVDGDDSEPEESDEDEDGPETCQTIKSDGEVCGRKLPCGYHSD